MKKKIKKYLSFKKMIGKVRTCNLCNEVFQVQNSHERICLDCKQDSDEYRFSEWLSRASIEKDRKHHIPAAS